MKKIDELRWIRIFTIEHLPNYLVDQVRHRTYSVEEFYKYQQLNLLMQGKEGIILNPFNHVYILADKENLVKGFVWITIDPLSKDIFIQIYSIDKEYWGRGLAVKKLVEHIKEIRNKAKLNKIFWHTDYPKHSERYNFKRSSSILMEYDPSKEIIEKTNKKTDKEK